MHKQLKNFKGKLALFSSITFFLLLAQVFLFAPLYELDTNYFITGFWHWNEAHPPFYNMFWSVCYHIFPSIHFLIIIQIFVFAISVNFFIFEFTKSAKLQFFFSIVFGIEPILSFYEVSILSESIFISLFLLTIAFFKRFLEKKQLSVQIFLLLAFSLLLLTRFIGILLLPIMLLYSFKELEKKLFWQFSLSLIGVISLTFLFTNSIRSFNNQSNYPNFWITILTNDAYLLSQETDILSKKEIAIFQKFHQKYQPSLENYQNRYEFASGLYAAFSEEFGEKKAKSLVKNLALEIEKEYFFKLRLNFIYQNFQMFLNENYLEYRYLDEFEKMHKKDYADLDSLILELYNFKIDKDNIPLHWNKQIFIKTYVLGIFSIFLIAMVYSLLSKATRNESGLQILLNIIAFFFITQFFTIIIYKTRFVVYLIPLIYVFIIQIFTLKRLK